MARISVVVPVFDVEAYVATCLASLARQTFRDLEVIVVDDGSRDASAAIAERFAERDRRFRVLRRANGGLGSARNAGAAAASGELLAFVDSDDVVADDAYARLAAALDRTGSDLATGNVLRLTRAGTTQARFLARAFARTRLATHVTRCPELLADRTAWNKLWRRSFWDAQGLRFPEGVIHEDIPVTLPAHLAARSVDVLAGPVYQWRLREDGALSITQRRREVAVLADRLAAIEHVRRVFAERAPARIARAYDASLVADDLRLHLDVLDEAGDAYRALFMEGAGRVLADVPERACRHLPALDRLKWHLVRAGRLDDLLEVLRFEREEGPATAPLRRALVHVGDYPFRGDRRRGVPRSAYRLGRRDEDLALVAQVDDVRAHGGELRVRGRAHIGAPAAPVAGAQQTRLTLLPPGPLASVRLRLPTRRVRTASDGDGFEARLDVRALRRGGAWVDGTWRLGAHARAGLVERARSRFVLGSPALVGAVDLETGDEACARALVGADGAISVEVRTRWARLERCLRSADDVLEIRCALSERGAGRAALVLRRRSDGLALRFALVPAGEPGARCAEVPLCALHGAPPPLEAWAAGTVGAGELWELRAEGAGPPVPVALPAALPQVTWAHDGGETALTATRRGDAALVTRAVSRAARPAAPAVAGAPAPVREPA